MSTDATATFRGLPSVANGGHRGGVVARLPRLRFDAAAERDFAVAHLRRARGRLRAWHSTVLAVLVLSVLPVMLAARLGQGGPVVEDAWSSFDGNLLLGILLAGTACRAALVAIVWTPWLEALYPRVALPFVAVCHLAWAFVCSGEILGQHPEYLAPLVTDAFAAYFFSGLLVRHALLVNLAAAAGLLLGGWYHAGEVAPILFYGAHLLINMVMAAIAGFAHERAARNLFVEHALLEEMAARDGLTGLKNRRAFDEHLERAWHQAVRDGRPLGILMIDVDAFKHYNDCYGHQAGDEALRRIADVVSRAVSDPLDLAARYGGEELAVILHEAPREHATEIAERLRTAVRDLRIEHRGAATGHVTASIGVALVSPRAHRAPEGAVQLADQALYEAKRQGRDRVIVLEHEYESLSTGVFRALAS